MSASAILVVEGNSLEQSWIGNSGKHAEFGVLGGSPIACVELLGRSLLETTVQQLQRDGVKLITVVVRDEFSHLARTSAGRAVTIHPVPLQLNLWSAAECVLREYIQHGVEFVLLNALGSYMEVDLGEALRFHRDTKQKVTALSKDAALLDFWIIKAAEVRKMPRLGLPVLLDRDGGFDAATYALQGYACPLERPADLRQWAVDALFSRCAVRPRGREVKPGIWLDDDAQIHSSARIEAPAYVGRGAKLRAETLVTQGSSLEQGCDIHEGTVIQDASILANTSVGKGLNVAHAIADGSQLLHLQHHVVVEVRDSKLLGRTTGAELSRPIAAGAGSSSLAERLLATAWE